MINLFTLGKLYPSDFLKPNEQPRCEPVELNLMMDDDGCVLLNETADKKYLWGKYGYKSGMNQSMKTALKDIVDSVLAVTKSNYGDVWLDIASNDGTLLSYVPENFTKVGVDPSDFPEASQHGHIIKDYFSAAAYCYAQKAKVITSIAMFYDIENREDFLKDINEVLDDNGVWVIQMSYSPLMINQVAFDNICHEHFYYYSLFNLRKLLNDNGFQIMDCQLNDINGGSFRVYVMKKGADISKFGAQPYRDVCEVRVRGLLEYEHVQSIDNPNTWKYFFDNINRLKQEVTEFISNEKAAGKTIWGYGASTKGNTLLQYFGLDNSLITAIADRNPEKWGMVTVGTNIPICSEDEMRETAPDYLLVLPWHFINEFKERESKYLNSGGKFIVPCPKFDII